MLFNSYVFIFAFLPVVVAVYLLLREYRQGLWAVAWLVVASLFYYAWWKPQFLLLLLVSISVNAVFGHALCSRRLGGRGSFWLLVAGVAFNLGLLGYFKYAGFFVSNLNNLAGAHWTVPTIVLPIGISFITFQKIAFLVDAYRGAVSHFSLRNYTLFVTFFPQLIAGPIVHHSEMMPQFDRKVSAEEVKRDLAIGLSIFCVGLFKKVVIADACAVYADAGYGQIKAGQPIDAASAWIAVFAYSFQLYYDFSGYSDMAVGLARLFGIRLPVNFFSPYQATGIIEFWRRWHITLSRFLRDYLYFPLGGNRRGPVRRHVNLVVVMLLGGFWHGANWTFVVWGGIHGALLVANHAWRYTSVSKARIFATPGLRWTFMLATFLAVTLAWVPFRAESMAEAERMLSALFGLGGSDAAVGASFKQFWIHQFADPKLAWDVVNWFKPKELWPVSLPANFLATYRPAGPFLLALLVFTLLAPNTSQHFGRFAPVLNVKQSELDHPEAIQRLDGKVAFLLSAMFVLAVLQMSRVSPFLYFQF